MPGKDSRPPLLEVRNLSVSFRNQENAIDRVSFKLEAGKTLGLAGASGAGKSSMARAILRLIEPAGGEVLFRGRNMALMNRDQLKAARRSIQIIFQEPSASLSPKRTVAQTLLEPLRHFGSDDQRLNLQLIAETLHTVGLDEDVLQRYPHQFSSGQQQRIAIARALVTQPELLIADEAVSSLDVSVQAQILQLMQSLQKDHGISIVFISHDLAVIRQISDEVAVMYRGQLLEHSPADAFFDQPSHPYSKALLSYASFNAPVRARHFEPDSKRGNACIYASICADRKPKCEHSEPEYLKIQHKDDVLCVKCHLYDEKITHDN